MHKPRFRTFFAASLTWRHAVCQPVLSKEMTPLCSLCQTELLSDLIIALQPAAKLPSHIGLFTATGAFMLAE